MLVARLLFRSAMVRRISATLLFGDARKAYYNVHLEIVLGPVITTAEREAVLASTGTIALRQQTLVDYIRNLIACLTDCRYQRTWRKLRGSGNG